MNNNKLRPTVEDAHAASRWGFANTFTARSVALAVAQRLGPDDREGAWWYAKVRVCARNALEEWLREKVIEAAPRSGQPTEYRFVKKERT